MTFFYRPTLAGRNAQPALALSGPFSPAGCANSGGAHNVTHGMVQLIASRPLPALLFLSGQLRRLK